MLYRGAGADDPGAYDDRAWIHATYATDGTQVDRAGARRVSRRAPPRAVRVRRSRRLLAQRRSSSCDSDDGGRSFARAGTGLVAGLPYRYSATDGRRAGYFNPSNILRRGDYLYAFVWAERFRAQRRGACLLRRPVEGGAGDWRAWDGAGFAVRFADPYREDVARPGADTSARRWAASPARCRAWSCTRRRGATSR